MNRIFGVRAFGVLCVLALLGTSGAAPASGQGAPVAITGAVVPTPGPVGCGQATHMLVCTNVFLYADGTVLDDSVGKVVTLLGHQVPSPSSACHVIKVDSAGVPAATLDWCGSPTPGCKVKFVLCPGGLSQFWLFASLSRGFKPLNVTKGTWLLGDPAFLIAQGSGGACHELTFTVPPLPTLVGVDLWLQGARRDIGPAGPITLTNVVCLTLTPGGPCVAPGC